MPGARLLRGHGQSARRVIPRADVANIVAKLDDIRRAEAALQEKVRAGMTQMDSLTELLKSDSVLYVD